MVANRCAATDGAHDYWCFFKVLWILAQLVELLSSVAFGFMLISRRATAWPVARAGAHTLIRGNNWGTASRHYAMLPGSTTPAQASATAFPRSRCALLSDAIAAFPAVIREQYGAPRAAELVPRLVSDPFDSAKATRSRPRGRRRAHEQPPRCCFADAALAASSPDHDWCRYLGLPHFSLIRGDTEFARGLQDSALAAFQGTVDLETISAVQPPPAPRRRQHQSGCRTCVPTPTASGLIPAEGVVAL
ncbi:hypothetical protein BC828DRAFT_388711 [Blastocladiella britannica]|nr:hypothetical protein BC828DRAFT_388711 [Blastocladiella britannica]